MAGTHRHRRILVVRTYDLKQERAVCLDCNKEEPGWRLVPYSGTAFYYRYISTEDFEKGVVPELKIGA